MVWKVTFTADSDKREIAVGSATAEWQDDKGSTLFSYSERCCLADDKVRNAFVARATAARDARDDKATADGSVAKAVAERFAATDLKATPAGDTEEAVT